MRPGLVWLAALPLLLSFLSACATHYQVVGKYIDYNELFRGDVVHDVKAGTAKIVAIGENSGIVCKGYSYVTQGGPECPGQRGRTDLFCDDGRRMEARWNATSCTTGYGYGSDTQGASFHFVFGLTEDEAAQYISEKAAEVADKPALPIYQPK